jgi:uncharacterized membrane protein
MAFCANCGSAVEGRFCQKCGAPVGAPAAPGVPPTPPPGVDPQINALPPPQMAPSIGMTNNLAGALCYLGWFVTGILFLVLAPYNQDRTIRFHAFQSIFLNIAVFVLWVVMFVVLIPFRYIPFLGFFISFVLQFVLWIGSVIVWLYMMFKTYNGEKIVLPVIGALAEKQAGV